MFLRRKTRTQCTWPNMEYHRIRFAPCQAAKECPSAQLSNQIYYDDTVLLRERGKGE